MRLHVLLFARLRELYGRQSLELELVAGATPETCFETLARERPAVGTMRPELLVAVNERYADWQQPLAEGDEVAFIPPVSGG